MHVCIVPFIKQSSLNIAPLPLLSYSFFSRTSSECIISFLCNIPSITISPPLIPNTLTIPSLTLGEQTSTLHYLHTSFPSSLLPLYLSYTFLSVLLSSNTKKKHTIPLFNTTFISITKPFQSYSSNSKQLHNYAFIDLARPSHHGNCRTTHPSTSPSPSISLSLTNSTHPLGRPKGPQRQHDNPPEVAYLCPGGRGDLFQRRHFSHR